MPTLTFRQLVIAAAVCIITVWVPVRPAEAEDRLTRIVALGDSLTAGYGLPALAAFPVQLEHALRAKGYSVTVATPA